MPESTQPQPKRSALDRFISGMAESIFHGRLGVADVQLVDYISDMLLRFVRIEGLHRVRRTTGEPATEVYQMLAEGQQRIGVARREIYRHIGDFTLFWTGVYPESLHRKQGAGSVDALLDYCQQGKRSYRLAAEIEGGQDRPPCDLLQRLSEQYDLCSYGLREVRRAWEQRDGDSSGDSLLLS